MGWGCYKHEMDAGSENWETAFDDLLKDMRTCKQTWGRDGEICPLCYKELLAQRDALLEAAKKVRAMLSTGHIAHSILSEAISRAEIPTTPSKTP